MNYEELRAALQILGLPSRAGLAEIKARHRVLVKRFHPDGAVGDAEQMRAINAAYRVVQAYCAAYRYDFSHEEFLEQNPEERLREQFAQDAIWRGR